MLNIFEDARGKKDTLEIGLKYLCQYAQNNESVQQWMFNSKDKIQDILKDSGWEKKRREQILH